MQPIVSSTRLKKIEAAVRKDKFPDVDLALKMIGVSGLTVAEEERASRGMWSYPLEKIPHMIVTVVVDDRDVGQVVDSIRETASTRSSGDGRIVVTSIDNAWDIGTGMPDRTDLSVPSLGF